MRRVPGDAWPKSTAGFAEPFMTAPSPGIIAAAMRNEHYDTEDAYLHALGQALRVEYEAIVGAGFLLQIDAPDLALERHVSLPGPAAGGFHRFRRTGGGDDQRGAGERPARPGAHPRLLGQLRGAARLRRGLAGHPAGHRPGQGRRLGAAVRQPAPCARIPLPEGSAAGRRSGGGCRGDRPADQLRRTPGGRGRPAGACRRRWSAIRRAFWPGPIAASTPRPGGDGWPRMSSGPSCARWRTVRGLRPSGWGCRGRHSGVDSRAALGRVLPSAGSRCSQPMTTPP